MANTRKPRVPMEEQLRLINECRRSGMSDTDWCREKGIAVSTFYSWVKRCRRKAADQIPVPAYGHRSKPLPRQEVVPVDIVPEYRPEEHTALPMPQSNLDHSHTIEMTFQDIRVCIRNDVDPTLLAKTLRLVREISC